MSNAQVAIKSARVYLNDINGVTWSDALLMPLLQEAYGELAQELNINNTGVFKVQTGSLTVLAGQTDLGNQQPSNILNPISMLEGNPGDDPDLFQDMIKVTFLPYTDQDIWLTYWAWIGDIIKFVGATQTRSIILRYEGTGSTPQTLNDPLGIIFAERYLGPRIAALAYSVIGRDNAAVSAIADTALYKLIQGRVVDDQRPTRRKGYRSFKSGFGPGGGAVPVGPIPSGGSSVNFIQSSTVPNGVIQGFAFPYIPKWVVWNGLTLFVNKGYTLAVINSQYTVTFIDVNGNPLTPGIGDIIEEAY